MLVTGIVKRVQDRNVTNGGVMRTYDIMDESVGRVQITVYPQPGEVAVAVGVKVEAVIGQVRGWVGKTGGAGVSLVADSIAE